MMRKLTVMQSRMANLLKGYFTFKMGIIFGPLLKKTIYYNLFPITLVKNFHANNNYSQPKVTED